MIQLIEPPKVPITEWSIKFLQGMLNRMGMSFFKYGSIKAAYPHKVDAIKSLKLRLNKYEKTGNTEYLIDVANFAMIEFTLPKHPDAHFKPEDSRASPGRYFHGEIDPSKRSNEEI